MDEHLLAELKRQAAATGSTVSRLIEESVRAALSKRDDTVATEFELITYGAGGQFTNQDVDRAWTLLEKEDVQKFGFGRPK